MRPWVKTLLSRLLFSYAPLRNRNRSVPSTAVGMAAGRVSPHRDPAASSLFFVAISQDTPQPDPTPEHVRPGPAITRHENDHHPHDTACERPPLPHELPHGTRVGSSTARPCQGDAARRSPALLPQRRGGELLLHDRGGEQHRLSAHGDAEPPDVELFLMKRPRPTAFASSPFEPSRRRSCGNRWRYSSQSIRRKESIPC